MYNPSGLAIALAGGGGSAMASAMASSMGSAAGLGGSHVSLRDAPAPDPPRPAPDPPSLSVRSATGLQCGGCDGESGAGGEGSAAARRLSRRKLLLTLVTTPTGPTLSHLARLAWACLGLPSPHPREWRRGGAVNGSATENDDGRPNSRHGVGQDASGASLEVVPAPQALRSHTAVHADPCHGLSCVQPDGGQDLPRF